jgi:hypothetical protein
MPTHVYNHPEQAGFGQHHAPHDLSERPAQPPEAAAGMRAVMTAAGLDAEQEAKMEAFLARTMADLDMAHGTPVEHLGTDTELNLELVEWTDKHGDPRITSVTPEFFASHFTAQEG